MRRNVIEQTALRDDVDELAARVDDGNATRASVLARREHDGNVVERRVSRHLDKRRSTRQVGQRDAVGDNELFVRARQQLVDVFRRALVVVRLRWRRGEPVTKNPAFRERRACESAQLTDTMMLRRSRISR